MSEYGSQASQDSQKEAVDVYDSKHGEYSDKQGENVSTGAAPVPEHNPLKLNGGGA